MAGLDDHEDGQVARLVRSYCSSTILFIDGLLCRKQLTISYIVTPLICIPLSAAVYAVQQSGVAKG